jgi:transposase
VLVELGVAEQRHRAVLEVLDGAAVTVVARRYGVSRQTVHRWLGRYAGEGGLANLVDRSSRPGWCPHQMPAPTEVRVIALRWEHRDWGPDRIRYQLVREGVVPVPGRSSVYRALVRNGLLDPAKRKRKRSDYRRWERGRATAPRPGAPAASGGPRPSPDRSSNRRLRSDLVSPLS